MKRTRFRLFMIISLLFITTDQGLMAQETSTYRKNAFAFNVTRMAVYELNMSYERFLTQRRSIEFDGGIIYRNNFLEKKAESWTVNPIFSEHGFAARVHYKIYRRPENNSKWQNYISFGLAFKHLYYDGREMVTDIRTDSSLKEPRPSAYHDSVFDYTIQYLQKRDRDKIGVEFTWGKVYEASRFFAVEFYYGAGLMANMVKRTDYSRYVKYEKPDKQAKNFYYPTFTDYSFYVHPTILVGIKIRLRV